MKETVQSLAKEFDRVTKKQRLVHEASARCVDTLIQDITRLQTEITGVCTISLRAAHVALLLLVAAFVSSVAGMYDLACVQNMCRERTKVATKRWCKRKATWRPSSALRSTIYFSDRMRKILLSERSLLSTKS